MNNEVLKLKRNIILVKGKECYKCIFSEYDCNVVVKIFGFGCLEKNCHFEYENPIESGYYKVRTYKNSNWHLAYFSKERENKKWYIMNKDAAFYVDNVYEVGEKIEM